MGRVIIGMDPHKRSATIEIIDEREEVLHSGRFATGRNRYRQMLAVGRQHNQRTWAIEGCQGIGRHLAQRLVADGETVIDVPAKLSARVRVLSTGQGRKTDPVDAHSVAVAGLRSTGLRRVRVDDATAALRLLVDHRDELGHARTQTVNRLHRAYYRRKLAAGKTSMEAMRCLKRRLSDVVYRQMTRDAQRLAAGSGGHVGATSDSSAADLIPLVSTSDKSLPEPANHEDRAAASSTS